MFTIKNLDELAGYFTVKAKEMNDIAQQRTGLQKHHYNGQAHAYNDCAIIIRSTRMEQKQKGRRKNAKATDTRTDVEQPDTPAGER